MEIKNLPAGADYTVNEIDSKGYDTTNVSVNGENAVESKSANGIINLDATNTVAYTNIDTVTPPTGVTFILPQFFLHLQQRSVDASYFSVVKESKDGTNAGVLSD